MGGIGVVFIKDNLCPYMSKNCELCNELLTEGQLMAGRCSVCVDITMHDLHLYRTPTKEAPVKGASVKALMPTYGLSITSTTIKEGFMCSYCEDIYNIDDMNNIIDRWLCNQCYNDHVLNE